MAIRILLVDDHQIVRQGLRTMLERHEDLEVVGEAADGRTAVRLAEELRPDVVVMDVGMPDMNGIEATRRIAAGEAPSKVVALSMHADRRFAAEMMRSGASGYVLKDGAFEELANAIRDAVEGRTYLSPRVADAVLKGIAEPAPAAAEDRSAFARLSAREREVLQLIAEGRATKEIAWDLNLSVKTIETHRRQIMEKLGLFSVAELTKYAVKEGITALEV